MHQHEHEYASSAREIRVLVHSGLKAHFESPHDTFSTLCSRLGRVEFIDSEDLAASGSALDLPVLVPVTSEFQAQELREIRVRHPLSLLTAVTNDISGHYTYYAIRSGANFVINLAIPAESQIDMLYAQFRTHRATTPTDPTAAWRQALPADHSGHARVRYDNAASRDASAGHGSPVREGRRTEPDTRPTSPPVAESTPGSDSAPITVAREEEHIRRRIPQLPLSESDKELVRLLCTSITVSEIARRYYCSERSMYRRIRKLYDKLGIAGRTELTSLAATLGMNQLLSGPVG
ncbi:helix-turn-helix transcriptional regulator [Streptomyces sp. NPDC001339]|uniref:helix-turn-helix transcriptional regulator n=1 Tax=Streptomyces sp. NPDC001339 TaxID=3364563 RepID=UPI00369EA09F